MKVITISFATLLLISTLFSASDNNSPLEQEALLKTLTLSSEFLEQTESLELPVVPVIDPSSEDAYYHIYTTSGQSWPSHNLSIAKLDDDYIPFKFTKYNPNSYEQEQLLLLKNESNNVYLEVLATRIGIDIELPAAYLDELYREKLNSNKKKIVQTTHETINGIDWTIYMVKGRFKGKAVLDFHYTAVKNGIQYTNLYWSYKSNNSFASLKKSIDKIKSSFSQQDENNYAHSNNYREVERADIDHLGIGLDLSDLNIVIEKSTLQNENKVYQSILTNSFFTLTPIQLGEGRFSMNEVVRGYEAVLNANYLTNNEVKRSSVSTPEGQAVEFTYELRDEEGKATGQAALFVIKNKNVACCIQFLDFSLSLKSASTPSNNILYNSLKNNIRLNAPSQGALLSEFETSNHGNFYNGIGLYNIERNNPNKAIKYFAQAYELAPESIQIGINLAQTLTLHGSYAEAYELANELIERDPENIIILQSRGACAFNLQRTQEGIADYQKILFEYENTNTNLINEYLGHLFNNRDYQRILEDIEKLQSFEADTSTLLYWEAAALRDSGKGAEARLASKSLYEMEPENVNIAGLHVDILLKEKDFPEALKVCDEFIEMTGNQQMKYFTGLCYLSQDQFAPARDALQECLDAMPGHVGARELLSHIHSLMGGTDPSLFNQPINPVDIHPSLKEIKSVYPESKLIRKGVYAEFTGQAIHYEKGKTQKRTRYMRFKILDEKGAQEFKEMTESFNPSYERIYINEANVYDENNTLIGSGNPNQFYLTNAGDGSIINEEKTLHITFPNVRVGSTVSLTVTHETNATVDKFQFHNSIMSGIYPRKYTFTQVSGDIEEINWAKNLDTIQFSQIENHLIWHSIYPNSFENVLFTPDTPTFIPMVWLASQADQSWEDTANSYFNDIEDYLNSSSPKSQEIASTLEHDGTYASKIDAVTQYISSNYSYKAILFGPKARIPRTFEEIEANKYGDCKDHTLLAIHLLRELGVESHPALVSTYRNANSDLISIDQFNHMILYLPEAEENKYVDPTDQFLGREFRPQHLEGQPALVIKESGSFIDAIGEYRKADNLLTINREVLIDEEEQAFVTENIVAEGLSAAYIRRLLFNVPQNEQTKVIQSYLKQAEPSIFIKKLELQNLQETHEPLSFSYDYSVERSFTSNGETLQGRCPSTWESLFYYHNKTDLQRTIPFRISIPLALDLNLSIKTPENYSINAERLFEDLNEIDQFGQQKRTSTNSENQRSNTINLKYQFSVISDTFEASQYPLYIEHANRAINRLALPVSFNIQK